MPAANAMFQSLFQTGAIVGPAAAGLLLAGAGVHVVYWIDVVSFGAALWRCWRFRRRGHGRRGSPSGVPGGVPRGQRVWRSTAEGLRFVRRSPTVQGAYLIDLNAMVFGMPRALFPALGATVFGGGATTVGLLYAAPGAGALLGALSSRLGRADPPPGARGHLRRHRVGGGDRRIRAGPAAAVALVLLAVAGWADVVSAVLRNTISSSPGRTGCAGG